MRVEAATLEMQSAFVLGKSKAPTTSKARGDEIAWLKDDGPSTLRQAANDLRQLGKALGAALAVKRNVRAPKEVAAVLARATARRGDGSILADRGPASEPPAMVARYSPGAGFRPHVDAAPMDDTVFGSRPDPRLVTAILYLNDMPQSSGGTLRLWRPGLAGAHKQGHSDLSCLDIPPRAGLLVVFWSAVVLHEVRPVHRGVRYAMSLWFNEPALPHQYLVEDRDHSDDDDDDESDSVRILPRDHQRTPSLVVPSSEAAIAKSLKVDDLDDDDDLPPPPPPPGPAPTTPQSQIMKRLPDSAIGTASAPPPASRKAPLLPTSLTTDSVTTSHNLPASKRQRQPPPFPVFEAE